MPERRRVTMECTSGKPEVEIYQIGHGQYSEVFVDLSKKPSICYKIPYSWDDDEAQKMQYAYEYMRNCSFPVLPHFSVAWGGEYFQMTDLTDGLRNLVVSLPDIGRVGSIEATNWTCEWHNVKPRNSKLFLEEISRFVQMTQQYNVHINNVGFFLVAQPNGILRTVIADYDDGILHDKLQKPFSQKDIEEQIKRISEYYKMVVRKFFPSLPEELSL